MQNYSLTFIGAISQFLVLMGIITASEATALTEGILALTGLVMLVVTIIGRLRLGGVNIFGVRTE